MGNKTTIPIDKSAKPTVKRAVGKYALDTGNNVAQGELIELLCDMYLEGYVDLTGYALAGRAADRD